MLKRKESTGIEMDGILSSLINKNLTSPSEFLQSGGDVVVHRDFYSSGLPVGMFYMCATYNPPGPTLDAYSGRVI